MGCDRCIVSIFRATSERVNSGPERTSNENTVQATMKPLATHAKANMGPRMIGGSGMQIISELVSLQNQKRRWHPSIQ